MDLDQSGVGEMQARGSPLRRVLPPREHLAMLKDVFQISYPDEKGGRFLLASSGQRPGTLLNTLQHTGRLRPQRIIRPAVSTALRSRNSDV